MELLVRTVGASFIRRRSYVAAPLRGASRGKRFHSTFPDHRLCLCFSTMGNAREYKSSGHDQDVAPNASEPCRPYYHIASHLGRVDDVNGTAAHGRAFSLGDSAMNMKCDHCRRPIGPNVHDYWRMRYCLADCLKAYQCRLDTETVGKIGVLESRSGYSRPLTRHDEIRKDAA
jgi:hypothetical protein